MTTPKTVAAAPPDADCDRAWDRIVTLARDHALVVEAYGGTMVLMTPETQRGVEGCRERVLRAHQLTEPATQRGEGAR